MPNSSVYQGVLYVNQILLVYQLLVLQSACFVGGEKRTLETSDAADVTASEAPPVKRNRLDSVPMSRVNLLLSREQMARDSYPLPYSQSGLTDV